MDCGIHSVAKFYSDVNLGAKQFLKIVLTLFHHSLYGILKIQRKEYVIKFYGKMIVMGSPTDICNAIFHTTNQSKFQMFLIILSNL